MATLTTSTSLMNPAFADGEVDPLGDDEPEIADVSPDEIEGNIGGVYDDENIPIGHDNNEAVYGDDEIPLAHDEDIAVETIDEDTDEPESPEAPAPSIDTEFDQRYGPMNQWPQPAPTTRAQLQPPTSHIRRKQWC
jgi:hypothetical protein